jgi:UDP-N-acetylmuramoyl-tripeptide--D-alanyl-D-alanine ligase
MKAWSPDRVADAAAARLIAPPPTQTGPGRVVIDSRGAGPGALFVGLKGANVDGGRFARQALTAGAWGILTTHEHAEAASGPHSGVLLAAEDPLRSLQCLATAWRGALGANVIGVTGSTGKTSTKDILRAILSPHRRTVASRSNFNTEIGLPLEILNAPQRTEVLVLEMAMRGPGQIAELASIAKPDVAIIVNVGPVHLELLGSVASVAAAKAELIETLRAGGTAVIPANEPLLEPYVRDDLITVRFGDGGDVRLISAHERRLEIDLAGQRIALEVPFTQAHLRQNLLAAVAAARAVGVTASGMIELALSPGRGQRISLPNEVTLIDDCYNANPMSMRAALDDLAVTAERAGTPRKVAVLGDMLELGPDERRFHREIGRRASQVGVDVLVTVGELAATMAEVFDGELHEVGSAADAASLVPALLRPRDVVLVKASRGVGLELVCQALGQEVAA